MFAAARRYNVPLSVLYAVGMTESGRKGRMSPWAMNIDGVSHASPTLQQGVEAFRRAKRAGARFIDIGCMQINERFHGRNFARIEDVFDPRKNVDYAARFLRDLRAREGNWTSAAARYNAGPGNQPAQRNYVCAVIRSMVASRTGDWTPSARKLCGPA